MNARYVCRDARGAKEHLPFPKGIGSERTSCIPRYRECQRGFARVLRKSFGTGSALETQSRPDSPNATTAPRRDFIGGPHAGGFRPFGASSSYAFTMRVTSGLRTMSL